MIRVTITFPDELNVRVKRFAKQAELNYSAAVRLLIEQSFGGNVEALLASEKVLDLRRQVDQVVREQTDVFISNVQSSLNESFGRQEEIEEEPEPEPEVRGLRGRKPAKARRR